MKHFLLVFAIVMSQSVSAVNKKPQNQSDIIDKAIRKELNDYRGKLSKKHYEKVKRLPLYRTKITNEGLTELANMEELTQLKHLPLYGNDITDAGLMELFKITHLSFLNLNDCKNITDAGLEFLAKCKNLEEIKLKNTQVTQEGVNKLQKILPKLDRIDDDVD